MPLPPFNSQGLLPEGLHPATEADLAERCVTPFPASDTRVLIFEGFCEYRLRLGELGISVTQWADGSFVDETRLNPQDIDVANFCDSSTLESIPPDLRIIAIGLLANIPSVRETYYTHPFLSVAFSAGHPYAQRFQERQQYWTRTFTTPQDYSTSKVPAPHRGRKGIALMTVGDPALAPATNMIDT